MSSKYLWAYQDDNLIPLKEAQRGIDYCCPKCLSKMRVREGFFKKRHFYHLKGRECFFGQGKTAEHLETQKYICSLLPTLEMEVPFKTIRRIADVYWPGVKIVFEIQCSPISKEELKARNRDYQRLGIFVVWIFHERHFNRRFLSAAEKEARKRAAYYTNINSKGRGIIYDQASRKSFFKKPRRYPVCIDQPIFPLKPPPITFRDASKLYFTNDLVDRILRGKLSHGPREKSSFFKPFFALAGRCLEKLLESLA